MNPYRCTFQMGMEKALEYRVNFVLSLLSAVFPIVIQTFLWNYLYGNSDAAAMTGYSYSQIMVYTLLASMVSHLVYTGFEYQVNEDIKNGGLNKYLVKPVNYRSYQFFSFLGEKAPQLLILLAVAAALLIFSVAVLGLMLSFPRVLAFLVSLILALVLNFFYLLLCGADKLLADGRESAVRHGERGAGGGQRRGIPYGYFRGTDRFCGESSAFWLYDSVPGKYY